MLRRLARSLITRGIRFAARHRSIHVLIKATYLVIPGLRPFVHRLLPRPAPVGPPTLGDIEAMLVFDRSRGTPGPSSPVTVEQLCQLARAA